jgi:hypothetical protein
MDRKPQPQKYSGPNKFNGNYISQPQIDFSEIDSLYSKFSTGEYDDMMKIIQSNTLLNFRNMQGETLIHAILKNGSSSLNETNILEIIQQLIHKNVSVNAMNNYNQTALHLASQKGFYNVIVYFLTLNVDLNKIDNYGNAPIHYLIDNFVVDCKKDEYFKETNKKLKKTQQINNYDKITENYMVLSLINVLNNNSTKQYIAKMRDIITKYKFSKILNIQTIFDNNKKKIDNIYKSFSSSHNEQIKNITFEMIKELNDNIYKTLLINNNQNFNEDFLNNFEITINNDMTNNNKNFKKNIDEIIKNLSKITEDLEDRIIIFYRLSIFTLYFRKYIRNQNDGQYNYTIDSLYDLLFINVPVQTNIYDYENIITTNKIIDEDAYNNELKFIMSTLPSHQPQQPRQPRQPRQQLIEIQSVPLVNIKNNTNQYILRNFNNIQAIINQQNQRLIEVEYNKINENVNNNNHNIFMPLINIYRYIEKEFQILNKEILKSTIFNYSFYYFNFINEKIINIINNLVAFINYYEKKINIDKIINELIKFYNSFPDGNIKKNLVHPLLSQIYYNTSNVKFSNNNETKMEKMKKELFEKPIETIKKELLNLNINNIVNEIYKKLIILYNQNNSMLEYINKNYSLKYLKKYFESVKNNFGTPLEDIIYNNLYPNFAVLPTNIELYRTKYFDRNNNINLLKIKTELLKSYQDYDYNILYKNGDFETFAYERIYYQNATDTFDIQIRGPTRIYLLSYSQPYNTGYRTYIFDSNNLNNVISNGIFKNKYNIADNKTTFFLKKNNMRILESIPIISLLEVSKMQNLTVYKIISLLSDTQMTRIVNETITQINSSNIPKKKKEEILSSLEFLNRDENKELLKKILNEKIILYLNSLITIDSNNEISYIINYFFTDQLQTIISDPNLKTLQSFIKTFYTTELSKYTFNKMIPNILQNNSSIFNELTTLLVDINTTNYTKQQHKLLLNKCISTNKIDILREKILGKINMRTLDKNGNTILNRLIDQYNEYAIEKLLILDAGLPTYRNNRDQNSIEYLFSIIKTINKSYTWDSIDKRIKTYQDELKTWIQNDKKFGDIQLNDNNNMIYNVILNSLYLFNESLWLILLTSPNGWKFEDKHNLKVLIGKYLGYVIEENLLIKTFNNEDIKSLNDNSKEHILNVKINELIKNLNNENEKLRLSIAQLQKEQENSALGINYYDIIKKNTEKITKNTEEIQKLEQMTKNTNRTVSQRYIIAENDIRITNLIEGVNIDWVDYKDLIYKLWNLYLPIINICNQKNNTKKYISYYNFSLLNLDYDILEDTEVLLLVDYYTKFIDNIYADYYDLEKYEDIEFNYINDNILNIIYLNVVDVVSIEMYSAIIGYIVNKYNNDKIIEKLKDKQDNKKITELYDIINKLLK